MLQATANKSRLEAHTKMGMCGRIVRDWCAHVGVGKKWVDGLDTCRESVEVTFGSPYYQFT